MKFGHLILPMYNVDDQNLVNIRRYVMSNYLLGLIDPNKMHNNRQNNYVAAQCDLKKFKNGNRGKIIFTISALSPYASSPFTKTFQIFDLIESRQHVSLLQHQTYFLTSRRDLKNLKLHKLVVFFYISNGNFHRYQHKEFYFQLASSDFLKALDLERKTLASKADTGNSSLLTSTCPCFEAMFSASSSGSKWGPIKFMTCCKKKTINAKILSE